MNKVNKRKKTWISIKRNWQLYVFLLLPLAYAILFHYWPMYGLQIAFRDYSAKRGIWGSEWVGLENFMKFFENFKWSMYVGNTIKISVYSILVGFPLPIILALLLHVNEHKWLKKITQNISYIPHFISVVVLVGILNQMLDPMTGIWGTIIEMFNLNVTSDVLTNPDAFIHLYVWSDVWADMGWSAIIYISALSAVPQELHEAAKLDGASRWQRLRHVDFPTIMPTVIIMFILRCGSIMSVGHEKVYLMQNALNMDKSEVISTYVYKNGIARGDMSYGTAVGLMNSVINTGLVLLVNWIVNKMSNEKRGLF